LSDINNNYSTADYDPFYFRPLSIGHI